MPLDWLCTCAECKQTSGLAGSCSIIVKPMGPFLSQGVNILSFVIGKKNSEQGNNGTVSAKGVQ